MMSAVIPLLLTPSNAYKKTGFGTACQQTLTTFVSRATRALKASPPHKYNRLPLEPMEPTAREFGDRLHIDLLSMPRSADGHVAICTAVDAATGFVFATPCFDKLVRPSQSYCNKQ